MTHMQSVPHKEGFDPQWPLGGAVRSNPVPVLSRAPSSGHPTKPTKSGTAASNIDVNTLRKCTAEHHDKKLQTYDTMLQYCLRSIKRTAEAGYDSGAVKIPSFMFGLPKYDLQECIDYVCRAMRKRGMHAYCHRDVVMVQWSRTYDNSTTSVSIKQHDDSMDRANLPRRVKKDNSKPKQPPSAVGARVSPTEKIHNWEIARAAKLPEPPPLVFPTLAPARLDTRHMHPHYRKYTGTHMDRERDPHQQISASVQVERITDGAQKGMLAVSFV